MKPAIPRPEHPRPQFQRADWLNLNGAWTCLFNPPDESEKNYQQSLGFQRGIQVPFCPESPLSGIGYTDFITSLWYHREFTVPVQWSGKLIYLHFGAVDFECWVYVDGNFVGHHLGGSTPFSIDITHRVRTGKRAQLVVHVHDDIRSRTQAGGKQSVDLHSAGCFYTRVTGIWQTVWLEPRDPRHLCSCTILPDYDNKRFYFFPRFSLAASSLSWRVRASYAGEQVGECMTRAMSGAACEIRLDDVKHWSPASPNLYDFAFELVDRDGQVVDQVSSSCGIRKIEIKGNRFLLNEEPLYLRFVLDQGYYPSGIWTAPDDASLRRDIELAMAAGFNGARLHQKVFEERFHYWADVLGFLTWGEAPSWGLDVASDRAARNFLSEWAEIVTRDKSHPSIIAWTPLNETWDISNRAQHTRLHMEAYALTQAIDPSRPINDASGGCHVKTDIYTVHIYEQEPPELKRILTPSGSDIYRTLGEKEVPYEGQPYVVDEFGGAKWIPPAEKIHDPRAWGYGEEPDSYEEFYRRVEGQVNVLLSLPHISGYCYTQLTDVEQEQNGIYAYDRSLKFDMERIRRIFSRDARKPEVSTEE